MRITFLLFPLTTATLEVPNNNNEATITKRQLLHFVYGCSEIFGDNRYIMLDVLTFVTSEVTLF